MKKNMNSLLGLSALALASLAGSANASVVFTGTSGSLAAKAEFDVSGSNLVVTLTNTSTMDAMNAAHLLTTLFFNMSGSAVTLTPVSAIIAGGSTVLNQPFPAGGDVGGEWCYKYSGSGLFAGMNYGIGSAGLGIFGNGDIMGGPNLQGPTGPNGAEYGITSAGDIAATGNGSIAGQGLIQNSVVFTFSGLPQGFDLNRIYEVYFLYGTATNEGGFHAPTPGAAALLAAGGLLASRRRRTA